MLKYAPVLVRSISYVRSRTPAPLQTRARQPRPRTLLARRHQSQSAGARLLGETSKRPAERAERAETSNPWEMGPFPTMARSGGNWRKPPVGTLLEEPSAVLPSHPKGALQALIGVSLAEIA